MARNFEVNKLNNYPHGLYARKDFFRCLKSMFNTELKEFILSRMRHSEGNLKPVIVIDDSTKLSKCYIANDNLTDFIEQTDTHAKLLCLRVNQTAEWQIKKTKIQKSNMSNKEKIRLCDLLESKYILNHELKSKDIKEIEKI